MKADVAVAEWAERFPRPAASTTANNASQAKHFGTFFDDRELESITREEFRRYALVHPGAARYARTMLGDYLDARLIGQNVADGVSIPRRPTKKVIVPTAEEIKWLCEMASQIRAHAGNDYAGLVALAPMIRIAAYTGLREGELRALATPDIIYREDDESRFPQRLTVEYSIDRREQLKDPKTPGSEATIAIFGPARSHVHAAVPPPGWSTSVRPHRLFAVTRSQRQRAWDRVRKAAGISVTWHSLRHFCATYLLDNDAAIDDVALQLRCSVEEVRNTYGHPNREAALSRLEAIVDGA
jgi:integrase